MIRSIQALIATVVALAAFGATSASTAQAANEFHCSVEPCTLRWQPDGTGKTAHHVLLFRQGEASWSLTCEGVTGQATSKNKTFTEVTFNNIVHDSCSGPFGEAPQIVMNGCGYLFKITGAGTASVTFECEAGKAIEFRVPILECVLRIGAQGPLSGVTLHDAKTGGVSKQLLTMSMSLKAIAATANNKCGFYGFKEGAVTVEYVTGNLEITAETDPGGVMANVWFE